MIMMRYAVAMVLILAVFASVVVADDSASPRVGPSDEQIPRWIVELGARRFEVRDRATQALIAAGRAAIEPVQQAVFGADREVALRAVVALQEIGARGDSEALQAAHVALTNAAGRATSPAVARQAAEALETLTTVRQERTIEHLQKLGAVVTRDDSDSWYQQAARFPFTSPVFAIEFGPQWRGGDADLERLQWISDIEHVSFVGSRVKDSWIGHLKHLPKLHSIKIKRAEISNEGLAELARLEGIWFLRLMFVPLDDSAVPILESAKGLRRLVFISQALTDKGIEQLQQHLGKDNVECPKGAMLGIKASVAEGENWAVTSVLDGSAAAKAGILEGDRIVSYNGQPVTDFASLRSYIGRNVPGDTATLVLERGLEKLTRQVTFGEWD
jgi:hypothetical protein